MSTFIINICYFFLNFLIINAFISVYYYYFWTFNILTSYFMLAYTCLVLIDLAVVNW